MWLVRTETNRVLQVLGPFTKEKLCQMIQGGELGPQDEVCEANRYWIFLHETDEVVRQLGIQPPRGHGTEDTTETQTQTKTEPDLEATDPDLRPPAAAPSHKESQTEEGTVMYRAGEPGPQDASKVAPDAPDAPDAEAAGDSSVPLKPAAPPSVERFHAAEPLDRLAPDRAPLLPDSGPPPAQGPFALAPAGSGSANPGLPGSNPGPHVIYRPMVLGDIQRPSAWRVVLGVLLVVAVAALILILSLLKHS